MQLSPCASKVVGKKIHLTPLNKTEAMKDVISWTIPPPIATKKL